MEELNNTQELDELLKDTATDVAALLKDREKLLRKKPFTRGGVIERRQKQQKVSLGGTVEAKLPKLKRYEITQDDYAAELDPYMHSVLFDENIPSIAVKTVENGAKAITFAKMAYPFQRIIMEKQTLHMSCLPLKFTIASPKPADSMQNDFVTFKEFWELRNQDVMKVKAVATAKSYGEVGWLFYYDRHGEIKSRILSYEDGYVLCSHNDANGDRMLEVVYYTDENGDECIDCYDDTFHYRITSDGDGNPTIEKEKHGFSEIPLDTKRCKVAWDNGQSEIEGYERAANIDNVIDNKWGWGLLYVKGRIDPNAKKIAGNIVLNDTSVDPSKSDAKFLDPPSAKDSNARFEQRFKQIQIATGTTFILPSDIHTSSDTSGIAVQMTQSLDIQTAENGIIEWQNFIDKAVRLFKEGLAKELVNKEIKDDAVTEFAKLRINAKMLIWKPYSITEYNTMLGNMKNNGILSRRTAIEQSTEGQPDEVERCEQEERKAMELELEKTRRTRELESQFSKQTAQQNNNVNS